MYITVFGFIIPVYTVLGLTLVLVVLYVLLIIIHNTDPVYNCKLHLEKNCALVNGLSCNYRDCKMLKEYNTSSPEVIEFK